LSYASACRHLEEGATVASLAPESSETARCCSLGPEGSCCVEIMASCASINPQCSLQHCEFEYSLKKYSRRGEEGGQFGRWAASARFWWLIPGLLPLQRSFNPDWNRHTPSRKLPVLIIHASLITGSFPYKENAYNEKYQT
jgi:hypothetical protein